MRVPTSDELRSLARSVSAGAENELPGSIARAERRSFALKLFDLAEEMDRLTPAERADLHEMMASLGSVQ